MAFDVKAEPWRQPEWGRTPTLRVARAFPGDRLVSCAPVPPRRPFAAMCEEIARIALSHMRGLAENRWRRDAQDPPSPAGAAWTPALLDETRTHTRRVWPAVDARVLLTRRDDPLSGQASARPYDGLLAALENESHHRGQASGCLREPGVTPPQLRER